MNVAADLQHVRSLDAMSRALRASRSSAQILVEIRTSFVRDMLNARYYDSTQGQFISEDPIFLSSSQNLNDPQSLNAYSYSEDNPITKEDTNGLAALRMGLGAIVWNVSIGAGLTIGTTDDGGYSVGPYLDVGPAVGGEVSGPEITTANLPEQYAITTGASVSGGTGDYGVEISKDETYYPYSKKAPQSSQEATVGLIGGLGGAGASELYLPLITWGNTARMSNGPVVSTPVNNWGDINVVSSISKSNVVNTSNTTSGGGGGNNSFYQTLNSLTSALHQLSSVLSSLSSSQSSSQNK